MKIVLINGSPKRKDSASGKLLKILKRYLAEKAELSEVLLYSTALLKEEEALLQEADAWVISCPLYMDGVPAHLLTQFVNMEERQIGNKETLVYGIVNCGFYEGIQAEYALEIMKNWCAKAGLTWGGGVGVGGGGSFGFMPDMEQGPMNPIYKCLASISERLLQKKETENQYVSVAYPRWLYKMGGQSDWRKRAKANGLKVRNLADKPQM